MMKYLFRRYEFNVEQKYWFCWIFANTYHLPTAWVIWNEFPDFSHVGFERLQKFQEYNYTRLPYQKDQKWLRGRLPETFSAYKKVVDNMGSQQQLWDWSRDKFSSAWGLLLGKDFPRFGRYTAWFYLQALNECCGHKFVPPSMFFNDPSCKQPREGCRLAMGKPDASFAEMEEWGDYQIILANGVLADELGNLPVQPDRFSLETSLCAWSKMPRGAPKGRYLGYYLDRMAEDIVKTAECDWVGIEWGALWEGRAEILLPDLNHKMVILPDMDLYTHASRFVGDTDLAARLDEWFTQQCSKSQNFLL